MELYAFGREKALRLVAQVEVQEPLRSTFDKLFGLSGLFDICFVTMEAYTP